MQVRVGDVVRFISEKLEGKVTGIVDQSTVNVYCDEYGFEIPASVRDLVVIRSDFSETSENGKGMQEQKSVRVEPTGKLFIAFVPDKFHDLLNSRFEISFVNDTSQMALYSVAFFNGEKHLGIVAGNCDAGSVGPIGSYSLKELDAIQSIRVQSVFFRKGVSEWREAVDVTVKVNPIALTKGGNYKHARWFDGVSFLRPLDKEEGRQEKLFTCLSSEQLQQAKREKADEKSKVQLPLQKQGLDKVVEVDLHIHELLDTTAGMEGRDMLEYQLKVFRETLEEYKLRKGQKIVFIHGKGDGVLRQRILWELKTKYKRFHHQDASFKQYGYGATLVTIR